MPDLDPVAAMCREMGLPPPAQLRQAARTAAPRPRAAGGGDRPVWPPGFVPQLPALLAPRGPDDGNSTLERSLRATEGRQQRALTGAGWGDGHALAPALVVGPRVSARARAVVPVVGFVFRGDSLAYRAWRLVGEVPLPIPQVATALRVDDRQLRSALSKARAAGVMELVGGLLRRGRVQPGLPAWAGVGATPP